MAATITLLGSTFETISLGQKQYDRLRFMDTTLRTADEEAMKKLVTFCGQYTATYEKDDEGFFLLKKIPFILAKDIHHAIWQTGDHTPRGYFIGHDEGSQTYNVFTGEDEKSKCSILNGKLALRSKDIVDHIGNDFMFLISFGEKFGDIHVQEHAFVLKDISEFENFATELLSKAESDYKGWYPEDNEAVEESMADWVKDINRWRDEIAVFNA